MEVNNIDMQDTIFNVISAIIVREVLLNAPLYKKAIVEHLMSGDSLSLFFRFH